MSERSCFFFVLTLIFGVAAALIFYLTPDPVYKIEDAGEGKESIVETALKTYLSENLYSQYKTDTLPVQSVKDYVKTVESGLMDQFNANGRQVLIGQTEPYFLWKIFGAAAVLFGLGTISSILSDSTLYKQICRYWEIKGELKQKYNAEQIKTLEQIRESQERINQL